jgi:hypothetical protein
MNTNRLHYALCVTFEQKGPMGIARARVCAYDDWLTLHEVSIIDDYSHLELDCYIYAETNDASDNPAIYIYTNYTGSEWIDLKRSRTMTRVLRAIDRAYRRDIPRGTNPTFGHCLLSMARAIGADMLNIDWPYEYEQDKWAGCWQSTAQKIDEIIEDKVDDYEGHLWKQTI